MYTFHTYHIYIYIYMEQYMGEYYMDNCYENTNIKNIM